MDKSTSATLLSGEVFPRYPLHLLTRVPVRLDGHWNYGSWQFFFEQLCDSYDVIKFIHGPSNTSASSSHIVPTPFTQDELKVDKIVLSWIFTTLSDSLQARLDTFLDFKMARSLLITEEMRLKSKSLSLPVDSSSASPMVLMADSGNSRRPSNELVKSWRPCFNFAKGTCRFGSNCKFVHASNVKSGDTSSFKITGNQTNELLAKLLNKLGVHDIANDIGRNKNNNNNNVPTVPSLNVSGPSPPGPVPNSAISQGHVGQATQLPNAFTAGTLHDPTTGMWHMDT
ncbi:ribonuclease H-like domain-containing protein, partial [Tanacetum coccineum]